MATEVIYQIGVGHKRPGYDTILAWLTGTQVDCVSSGVIIVGELMKNERYDEDGVVFVGATTDEDNYRVLRSHPSVRHTGKLNTGAEIYSDPGGNAAVVAFEENYARLENVELNGAGGGNMYAVFGNSSASGYTSSGVLARDCRFGGFVYENSGTMTNCLTARCGLDDGAFGGFAGVAANANLVTAKHCVAWTAVDNRSVTGFRYINAINCASFGFGSKAGHKDYLNLGTDSQSYAASDTTGDPAGLDSLTDTDLFVSLTSGSTDFRLLNSSNALNDAGSGAGITNDIENNSRNATTPDVGIHEWPTAQSLHTIQYLSALKGQLPMSGNYDFSTATVQLPTGAAVPDIQSRAFDGSTERLSGQVIYMPVSGSIFVAGVDGIWIGFDF